MDATNDIAGWFDDASAGVLAMVDQIPAAAWDAPGLGEWTVRELLAHIRRSWTLIGTYLAEPEPPDSPAGAKGTAASYFAQGLVDPAIHVGVLQRGREDAAELGPDPSAAMVESARIARSQVATTSPNRLIVTRIFPLPFYEFVRTRAYELTIHGLDLARATGLDVPEDLQRAISPALQLTAEIADARGLAIPLLLAATGREGLPSGFTLLG